MLLIVPMNRATVLDSLAATELSPTVINAGSVTKEPPPATAFIALASRPAAQSRTIVSIAATLPGGHVSGNRAQAAAR